MSRKEQIIKDTRALIRCVTDLEPTDENFRLCVDFADSNFRYHRFLSPDSHKIERAVDGLCEKFRVHSQLSKADDLKELADQFLAQDGLEGRDHGKTNTHYALLSLLIELSESPTNSTFQRTKPVEKEEEVDDFDWRAYLLEPQDVYFISHASSDSEEEWSDDDDGAKERRVAWVDEIIQDGSGEHERLQSHGSDGEDSVSTLRADSPPSLPINLSVGNDSVARQPSNDHHFLETSLVVEYWKGKGREEEGRGGHSSSNLAKDWNCYQQRMDMLHTPSVGVFVTEAQVMRETLWMLSGVCDLFIFTHDNDGRFGLNPDVYMSHLTPESLSSFLQPLMDRAGQVIRLQTFVKAVISHNNNNNSYSNSSAADGVEDSVPQTYQAFADRVWSFLTDFKMAVTQEEQIAMAQEEMMSLSKMCSNLRTWLDKLDLIHTVFVRGVKAAEHVPGNNAIRTSLLLNTLYQVLHEVDPIDCVETGSQSELVLNLLVHSSRPLLDITSNWITNGQLSDPMQEFVVQRNEQIKSLDETFWEKAFVSHVDLSADTSAVVHAQKAEAKKKMTKQKTTSSGKRDKKRSSGRDATTTTTVTDDKDRLSSHKDSDFLLPSYAPIFLQNSLNDTLVTGKSMEVLENLGRLGEVLPGHRDNYIRPPSLFELLLEDLNKTFPARKDEESTWTKEEETIGESLIPAKDPVIHSLLNARGTRDTLLNINFASIFSNKGLARNQQQQQQQRQQKDGGQDLKVSATLASSILRHSENCLQSYVRSRYNIVCPRLVDILKSEYNLVDCIHAMQRYYLMSDGDIMSEFCYPIFHKIECRDPWQDPSILDLYLHEAIGNRYPEDTDRLHVEIVPPSKARGPINITDCIRLKYHVPWPVDVVISGKCEDRYNSIFSFLLQIKRSKSSLEKLRFEDLSRDLDPSPAPPALALTTHLGVPAPEDEMDRHTRVHRFQLLRFRLLYFVNSLHNYIMTRILHSSGLEFAHRLESATDLDQIISIHGAYVDIIYERCLLHSQLTTLKDTIVQILNLSLACSAQWHQGVDFIRGSFIQEMELKLTRCINFLSSFLVNVTKRGSFPQLESLAVSLTSMQQQLPQ